MSTFSTYHPLVVHFPIVLLIVAAVLQLIYLKYPGTVLRNIIMGVTAGGLLGAYLSGSFFHPHTTGLPESARIILEEHEKLSAYALYTALAAFLLQLINLFVSKKLILNIVIALILTGSAIFVSLSGHHGAMLTHIEGVGPQGKYIEHHHH